MKILPKSACFTSILVVNAFGWIFESKLCNKLKLKLFFLFWHHWLSKYDVFDFAQF